MGTLGILMGLQTVMQLSGQHQQAKQQEQAYKAQAQAAQQNAAIMSRQREQQAEAYAQKQSQHWAGGSKCRRCKHHQRRLWHYA